MRRVLLWVGSSREPGTLAPLLTESSAVLHGLRVGLAVATLEHLRSGAAVIIRVAQ